MKSVIKKLFGGLSKPHSNNMDSSSPIKKDNDKEVVVEDKFGDLSSSRESYASSLMGSPVWSPSTSNNNNFYFGAVGDFNVISKDILIEIFLFLKPKECMALRLVCKDIRWVLDSKPKIWKSAIANKYHFSQSFIDKELKMENASSSSLIRLYSRLLLAQLYTWGSNEDGFLGTGVDKESSCVPSPVNKIIETKKRVKKVHFEKEDRCIAVLSNGKAFVWGRFSENKVINRPIELSSLNGEFYKDIRYTSGSYLALSYNKNGVVSVKYRTGESLNKEIFADTRITKITSFKETAYFLAKDGKVYCSGKNIDSRVLVDIPHKVIDFSCGPFHSMFLTEDGQVFASGKNKFGLLASPLNIEKSSVPIPIVFPEQAKIVQVSAGFLHSVALDSRGRVWTWGSSAKGQLGIGKQIASVTTPTLVESIKEKRVIQVVAGGHRTFCLTDEGSIWGCGWNLNYQEDGNQNDITKVMSPLENMKNKIATKIFASGSQVGALILGL